MDKEDKKAFQLAWLEKNEVEDKDSLSSVLASSKKDSSSPTSKKQKKSTGAYHTEQEVDFEIDLHGFHIEDAMAEVAMQIDSLISAGYKSMRVIHGYSNSSKESIRSALLLHLKTKWNQKVELFFQEPHNYGATCIMLKNKK